MSRKMTATIFAILLVIIMIFFSLFINSILGKTSAYIITFCVYWCVFCIPGSFYHLRGFNSIKSLYAFPKEFNKTEYIYIALAFLPCIATFMAVFINVLSVAPFKVFLLAVLFALANGIVEELFWRGVFVAIFPKDIIFGYILPTLLFGLWHIALYFSKDIVYQGGFINLVGGSMFMGALWGFIAYRTKSIKATTVAHVITNIFAFSGLIYDNWFIF